jgi:FAD:protein FMN transferase
MNGMRRHAFRSMGTTVALLAPGGPGFDLAAANVELTFAAIDARFSRFRDDSELTRVNARAGRWTRVSRTFAHLLRLSLEGAAATGGLFDPTILNALVAAGYDRDFAQLRTGGTASPVPPTRGTWSDVQVGDHSVRLPEGVGLDFGGVAKGWAVDRASEAAGALPWAVVDAGGDLRVTGRPPEGGVDIAVEHPHVRGREILRLKLDGGALATSSVAGRTWGPGLHQLIDPRTSRPAATEVVQATVWSETCAEAEIWAKQALLTGVSVLAWQGAVLVMEDGRMLTSLEGPDRLGFDREPQEGSA